MRFDMIIISVVVPGIILAIFKIFLQQYEQRGLLLEKERQRNLERELNELRALYNRFFIDIKQIKEWFSKLDKDFAILSEKLKFQSSDLDKLIKAFKGYVESNNKRIEMTESKVTEISKEVYRVSSTKPGGNKS